MQRFGRLPLSNSRFVRRTCLSHCLPPLGVHICAFLLIYRGKKIQSRGGERAILTSRGAHILWYNLFAEKKNGLHASAIFPLRQEIISFVYICMRLIFSLSAWRKWFGGNNATDWRLTLHVQVWRNDITPTERDLWNSGTRNNPANCFVLSAHIGLCNCVHLGCVIHRLSP